MKLLETYKNRLRVSESVYNKEHCNEGLSEHQKITIAKVLANTSAYLNESFSNSTGTQRTDLGTFKKFCLDLTTVSLPTLIANDLVIVKPMTAMTGYIQYLQFVAGTNKGGVAQGDLFNDPFKLGQMTDERVNYTGQAVVEAHAVTSSEATAKKVTVEPVWTPFVAIKKVQVAGTSYAIVEAGSEVADTSCSVDGKAITFASADTKVIEGAAVKFGYLYDNVIVPQDDLPILNAKMSGIALEAHARRIAIYY